MDQTLKSMRAFFKMESAGGITLMLAAVAAMIFANSELEEFYHWILHVPFAITIGGAGIDKELHHWINDGLMAVFFFLVGMEIKREVMEGELSTVQQAILPVIAALGGIAVPALIYLYFNEGGSEHGWAIPAATDIAFALGVLALFGKRVPISLKIFLTAVAVIDDLGAIVIIALFYTQDVSGTSLIVAGACLLGLYWLNKRNSNNITFYLFLGLIMWVAVLKSGIHATLAGVALGLFIPHTSNWRGKDNSMLLYMEHSLHPWVAFGVLPIFAFANAGIDFATLSVDALMEPIPLGVAAGLFFGKQIGIFAASMLSIKFKIAKMPDGVNLKQFYAVCVLCGIGFTMSLFIGGLAFDSLEKEMMSRAGIIAGSVLSAVVGSIMLALWLPKQAKEPQSKPKANQAVG